MILCCGEALIDMIPEGADASEPAYRPHTGGAIFNTSIALGRLGVEVGLLSGVSRDVFGQMLARTLEDNKVSTQYLLRSDRLTTLAIVHMQNGSATYAFYDEGSAGRMLDVADFPDPGADVAALYFGGISLVAEPAADAYAAYLKQARAGRIVMIDPNIRPGFITDEAAYRARLDGMIAQSDIVKVSDEDLDWLVPGNATPDAKAETLRARGPWAVILTKGAEGASAILADRTVHVSAPVATVVDTVGAGDTFNAGFLAGLQDRNLLSPAALPTASEDDLRHALNLGASVAAVTVSRAGANPPWAHEIGR